MVASAGLWSGVFGGDGGEPTPQAKAMVAVNAMRLEAFQREADASPGGFETRIVSFDSAVSTRNLAVMGWPRAPCLLYRGEGSVGGFCLN